MNEFYRALSLAAAGGSLRKLILSKPVGDAALKTVGRLFTKNGVPALALEETRKDGKVFHKNLLLDDITEEFTDGLLARYMQANLLTEAGDAEYRRSKSGKEIFLGGATLLRNLAESYTPFTGNVSFDRQKSYFLSGDEAFLKALGISAENGRIHDKKQAKFRQIQRFLEHIDEIYSALPESGDLLVYDLCCGKSYLSFAVYHYLTVIKNRKVEMLGMDLKSDVVAFCNGIASESGFDGMRFIAGDIRKAPRDRTPDLVISLHACDVATDIVLETAVRTGARVILSTPCCHRFMNDKVADTVPEFLRKQPFLRNKFCEVATDALRALYLESQGYRVTALELTDPDDTPKNTLLRAVKRKDFMTDSPEAERLRADYEAALRLITGRDRDSYFGGILG